MEKVASTDMYEVDELELLIKLGISGNKVKHIDFSGGRAIITVSRGLSNE